MQRRVIRIRKTVEGRTSRTYRHSEPTTKANSASDRLPMVSLTLFFSSLLPCLLHVCLYVWSVTAVAQTGQASPDRHSVLWNNIKVAVTARLFSHVPATWATQWSETWHGLAGTLQKEGIDEMWVVVRLLAGMSSGFGLRGTSTLPLQYIFFRVDKLSARQSCCRGRPG